MERELGAIALVAVLLAAAGCTGALGGGEAGEIVIESERGPNDQVFVYAYSTAGNLPEGTVVAVNNTLPDVANASGTLGRPVDAETRVYLGGPLGSPSLTEFRHGTAPTSSLVPEGVSVTVTVTVSTGERTASETFRFEES